MTTTLTRPDVELDGSDAEPPPAGGSTTRG
jgi:hypothetical protein